VNLFFVILCAKTIEMDLACVKLFLHVHCLGVSVSACAGFEVLVGRNNRQNDVLTNCVATDYDLWFHARNIPGCHVTYISLSFPDSSFIEQLVSPDFSKVPPTHLSSF
jgi:hypothetical protein